jgi:hypothetical protein
MGNDKELKEYGYIDLSQAAKPHGTKIST